MTEEIKFEKALEKLEKIVEDLENGNIALDEALKKYEEGVNLSRICQKRLAQAEKKIEILTRSLDGTLTKEPFESDEKPFVDTSETPKKSRASREKERANTADEDLLI
jgi:exodeoxyribonuclease VII small subunit